MAFFFREDPNSGPEGADPDGGGFAERLRMLIERTTGGSQGGFASLSKVPPNTLRNYLQKINEPTRPVLVRLAAAGGVSVGWLAAGEEGGPSDQPRLPSAQADTWECPLYDIEFSAGSGREPWGDEKPVEVLQLPGAVVRDLFRPRGRTVAVRVAGDSMEPTIRDGAIAILDTSVTRVDRDGQVYAVRVDGALLMKRARWIVGSGVHLSSDNPSVPPVQLSMSETERLTVLGRVCGVLNRP
jgi:phage repressor protein C with HTH and peptisase S24 domain